MYSRIGNYQIFQEDWDYQLNFDGNCIAITHWHRDVLQIIDYNTKEIIIEFKRIKIKNNLFSSKLLRSYKLFNMADFETLPKRDNGFSVVIDNLECSLLQVHGSFLNLPEDKLFVNGQYICSLIPLPYKSYSGRYGADHKQFYLSKTIPTNILLCLFGIYAFTNDWVSSN